MTLGTLFLMVVLIYLVLIAYGVAGMRRKHMHGRPKRVTAALLVLAPPGLITLLLILSDERGLVSEWGLFLGAMPVAGAIVALLTEAIAARIER
jgi:hypothetical protein